MTDTENACARFNHKVCRKGSGLERVFSLLLVNVQLEVLNARYVFHGDRATDVTRYSGSFVRFLSFAFIEAVI